jgi:hypothetical protein
MVAALKITLKLKNEWEPHWLNGDSHLPGQDDHKVALATGITIGFYLPISWS